MDFQKWFEFFLNKICAIYPLTVMNSLNKKCLRSFSFRSLFGEKYFFVYIIWVSLFSLLSRPIFQNCVLNMATQKSQVGSDRET